MIRRVFRLSLILACFGVAVASMPDTAFAQGTEEQREACTGDANRLCDDYIPDANAVESCLRKNMSKLSGACKRQFGGGGGGKKKRR